MKEITQPPETPSRIGELHGAGNKKPNQRERVFRADALDSSGLRNPGSWYHPFIDFLSKNRKNNSSSFPDPETLKLFRSLVGIICALALAWLAKTETERRQRTETLNLEWPSRPILNSWLLHLGWSRLNPSIDGSETPPGIWISEDRCQIRMVINPEWAESWTCNPEQKSRPGAVRWIKIGSGFEGVNRLAESIGSPTRSKPKKPTQRIDPRELHY